MGHQGSTSHWASCGDVVHAALHQFHQGRTWTDGHSQAQQKHRRPERGKVRETKWFFMLTSVKNWISLDFFLPIITGCLRWKWISTMTSFSQGYMEWSYTVSTLCQSTWKRQCFMFRYMTSMVSCFFEMKRRPFVWASRVPMVFLPLTKGLIVRSAIRGMRWSRILTCVTSGELLCSRIWAQGKPVYPVQQDWPLPLPSKHAGEIACAAPGSCGERLSVFVIHGYNKAFPSQILTIFHISPSSGQFLVPCPSLTAQVKKSSTAGT